MTYLLRRAFTRRLAVAAALTAVTLLSPRASSAFCRTTTAPIPANYTAASGCFDEGLPLFWKSACVGYNANRLASSTIPLEEATTIIDASFGSWNSAVCTDTGEVAGIQTSNLGPVDCAEVRFNPTGANQNVIVFRENGWPYSDPNSTLGLTTVTFNADTGEILDADMELNASAKNLTTSATVPKNGFDLTSVITHEAGHFLGLAHATDSKSTMFASYRPGTSGLRTLKADDIAGLCAIYPNATTRNARLPTGADTIIPATACDSTPFGGFSTTCDDTGIPKAPAAKHCAVGRVGAAGPERSTSLGMAALAMLLGGAVAIRRRQRRA